MRVIDRVGKLPTGNYPVVYFDHLVGAGQAPRSAGGVAVDATGEHLKGAAAIAREAGLAGARKVACWG